MEPDRAWQAVGAGASAVGVAAVLSPSLLGRVFGLTEATTGGAALAWRLFGVRTALIGVAAIRGSAPARRAVLPVQAADQLVFARPGHRFRTAAHRAHGDGDVGCADRREPGGQQEPHQDLGAGRLLLDEVNDDVRLLSPIGDLDGDGLLDLERIHVSAQDSGDPRWRACAVATCRSGGGRRCAADA